MASNNNTSAVLDIVAENKEISPFYKDYDKSSICSGSIESLVQSPSIESFSTIQDIETISELNMDENSDLTVKINQPQKHLETLETFITFCITTKVARIEYAENEYVVRRRYNDFIWLRQKLVESHPFCIVPPLPGKHTLMGQLDRYSKDFILLRMKALNVFVSRIVNHPILSCNDHFKTFLTVNQSEFTAHRRQRSNSEVKIRTLSQSSSSHTVLKNRHLEFDKTKAYLTTLSEKLASIERIAGRINKERADFIVELAGYHPLFAAWARCEPALAGLLRGVGGALERSAAAQGALVAGYAAAVGGPVRDLVAYVDVAHETIRKREAHQCAYEGALEELTRRHGEKDRLVAAQDGGAPPAAGGFSLWRQPSCDEKLEKLGVCIPQLVKRVEANQDSLECANEALRSDLEHWQSEKRDCLKAVLLNFVNKQIEYYQSSVNAWEHVTGEIGPSSSLAASK